MARLACIALAFFPFSYVLSTNYSEGLFLLASIGAFTAARSRHPAAGVRGRVRRGIDAAGGDPARTGPRGRCRAGARAPPRLARRRRGRRGRRGDRVRRPRAAARRLARQPARAAARLEPLDQHRRRARRARPLRPRRHHARPRPEPALPDRECRWRSSRWWCCGATACATGCSCSPWSRWSRRSPPGARCRCRASSWARSPTPWRGACCSSASSRACATRSSPSAPPGSWRRMWATYHGGGLAP